MCVFIKKETVSRLANWLLSMADRWARWRHRRGFPVEPRIVIEPSGPSMEYVKPTSTDDYGWDRSHYDRGNIHYRGFYNPIEVRPSETDDEEVELLPSANYKAALLANEVIPKAMNPEPFGMVKLIAMATAGISLLTLFAVVALA